MYAHTQIHITKSYPESEPCIETEIPFNGV